MDILLIGGTGIISQAVSELALNRGHTVYLLNRGKRANPLAGRTRDIIADKNDRAAMKKAIDGMHFDAVANFIAYTAEDVEKDCELFLGKTRHYIAISSASAYQKPPGHYRITENTPLENPFWQYSRNKIAMEQAALRAHTEKGFPVTLVRPSYTYSKSFVPDILGMGFRNFDRIRQGKPLVVHGDGQSLWQMTFNEDFANGFLGLMGNSRAVGEAFHITSDEVLTWDQIYRTMARAVGAEAMLVHIPVEFLRHTAPHAYDGLKGDKMYSMVLDNSKIKSFAPDYKPSISYLEGMQRCLAWYAEHPEAGATKPEAEEAVERTLTLWAKVMKQM